MKHYIRIILAFLLSISIVEANELEKKIVTAFNNGEIDGIHSVYALHKEKVVAELYFLGQDERWGLPLGKRKFDSTSLHDLRSVTKSIVSLLYGIALSEGLVPDTDSVLIDQFSQYNDLTIDSKRREILVHHALSMMMGTEWDESPPYTSSANSEIAMEVADDRYHYILGRPIISKPGEVWTYNGGATALIAQLITTGAGKSIDEYAKEKLFNPLGIKTIDWIKSADGIPSAASGLRMAVPDLAKIGLMLNANGIHEGKQIVPSTWIERSFTPYTDMAEGLRYGYFWWLSPAESRAKWAGGFGNGGQRLVVNQDSELVVVIFAGNYNKRDAWKMPKRIISEMIVPSLFEN